MRLARRLVTILLAMRLTDALETTQLHRIAGLTGSRTAWVTTRPFRAPHSPISAVDLWRQVHRVCSSPILRDHR
jgi:magnesium chelatase family protein